MPKTAWATRLNNRAALGFGVLEAAIPAPIPGCIMKNGPTRERKTDDQGREQGRMTRPFETPYRQKYGREDDADRVVGGPADNELAANGRCFRNIVVHEASAREVAKPAAHPSPIGARQAEHAFRKLDPEIKDRSGANADQHRTDNEFQWFSHS